PVLAGLSIRWARRMARWARPVAAGPLAGARLRRPGPDARPAMADRGGDVRAVPRRTGRGRRAPCGISRRPDPRRARDAARTARRRPRRHLEPLGPHPAPAPRGDLG